MKHWLTVAIGIASVAALDGACAQQLQSNFGPVPVPSANRLTPGKIALGKALFWDEQLSVTGTVACGTCHRPEAGGADPRSRPSDARSRHPGPDGLFGSSDDITGSMGVPRHRADGERLWSEDFGFAPQVTPRASRSVINSAFNSFLFWDGRTTGGFKDPTTGLTLIEEGGALETQALQPLENPVEMGAIDGGLAEVSGRIAEAVPLGLAEAIPRELSGWIAGRGYPALFEEVFGDPAVTPARIALAIASYERSLISDQSPFDKNLAGNHPFTDEESFGAIQFTQAHCNVCHDRTPRAVSEFFSFTGVRPPEEDPGQFTVSGNAMDLGRMQSPTLRNVALRSTFFHNGRTSSLEEVMDFYERGGDFKAPNKDQRVELIDFLPGGGAALVAFMKTFTDPRVELASGPFTRPTLYTESNRVPRIVGTGRAASGFAPIIGAIEPSQLGRRFTVTVEGAAPGANATLVVSIGKDAGAAEHTPIGDFANVGITLSEKGTGSVALQLPTEPVWIGTEITGRIYVDDGAATRAFETTLFGSVDPHIFADEFE